MTSAFAWFVISFCVSSAVAQTGYTFNQSSFYAGLAGSLAKYFHSACIYFLTDSRSEDSIFLEKVIKEVAKKYEESTNVYSFEEYHQFQASQRILQCYVPLQVVISHDEATRVAFAHHSQRSSMHGSDSFGGGVWLVFLDSLQSSFIEKYFDGFNTPFDVELIVAELKQNDEMKLKEVYRVRNDTPLRYPFFGDWSKTAGLRPPQNSLLYSRRSDLEGVALQVGFIDSAPFSYSGTRDGKAVIEGYMGDIWDVLQGALNVTSDLTMKKNYGTYSADTGRWSGIIDDMRLGDFDVAVADLALTQKRFEVMSYSSPLMITQFQVFYQTQGASLESDALFLPLAQDLWASLLGWLVLSALLLYIGCYLSDRNFETSENLTFPSSFFFVAGALCGQGGVKTPQRVTCRLLYIASFLITAVIFPSYSASLMSYLTIIAPHVPFTNMKQFYELGNFRMLVRYSSYEFDLFAYESTSDPYMNKVFHRDIATLPKADFPRSNIGGIRKVCTNKQMAFFGLSDAIQWAILKEERREGKKRVCRLVNMPFNAGRISLGITFPKSSHYRGLINHYIAYLPSTGILKRLRNKHWPITQPMAATDEHNAVSIQNVYMMFVVLGSGVTMALILLACELLTARKKLQATQLKKPRSTSSVTQLEMFHAIRRRGISERIVFYYN